MTAKEIERLRAVEIEIQNIKEDVSEIKCDIKSIFEKLDDAIQMKADRDEVKRLSDRMWAIMVAGGGSILGLLIYLLKIHLK